MKGKHREKKKGPADIFCPLGKFERGQLPTRASQMVLVVKILASAGAVRDTSSVPGLGRSPGEGHGSPLPYSYLENSMAATVHSHTELDTNGAT